MKKPRELYNIAEEKCDFQTGTWVLKDSEKPSVFDRLYHAWLVVFGKANAFRINRKPPQLDKGLGNGKES